jgi:predicted RNase H-like nuclease
LRHSSGSLVAIGVDGAPAGWAAACLHADALRAADARRWETRLHLFHEFSEIAELRDAAGASATCAIDIPIGLLDSVDYRPCDLEARRRLGRRAGSVFAPPARYMLEFAGDYAGIRALVERKRSQDPLAKGLSAQSAALAGKIAEVDRWVREHPECEDWLFECHPELTFCSLGDGRIPPDKRSGAGMVQRLRLIRELFPDAEARLAAAPWPGRQVESVDLLDAYAALSTALVCARGEEQVLAPERDRQGVPMRMVV